MARRPGRLVTLASVVFAVVVGATLTTVVAQSDAGTTDAVLGPGPVTVRLDVEHSRFSPVKVRVRPHAELRFVVVNHDPIGHELIIGDREVHARHELGNEPAHAPRPGEVSVGAHARASTTYVVHEPGVMLYACHLPGHFAYGMKGEVIVTRA